jgi:hypothetical protein
LGDKKQRHRGIPVEKKAHPEMGQSFHGNKKLLTPFAPQLRWLPLLTLVT